MNSLKSLSDKELIGRLRQLVDKEQSLTLSILPHLAKVERRKLHLERAHSSLFDYCKREFGYSDASAWRRAGAAIAILKCPEAWELLIQNRVSLTTLSQVSGIITPDVLKTICDKSKSEVELIVAAYRPRTVHPDPSRPVMVPKRIEPQVESSNADSGSDAVDAAPQAKHSKSLRGEVTLTNVTLSFEQKWKEEGVVSRRVHEKLERCKKLLSRKYPKGVDFDILFDELTESFLDHADPERRDNNRKTRSPKRKADSKHSRYISSAVKAKVWKRDGGRCAFVGSNGKRCNSNYNLQFDHYPVPYARGGPGTVDTLRLLCAKHNKYAAERVYGEAVAKKHYIKEAPGAYLTATRRHRDFRYTVLRQ